MDRLTHKSIINCVKELDALEKLAVSGKFSAEELADFIAEVSWNLSKVMNRERYDSDEFQHRLRKLMKDTKRQERMSESSERDDEKPEE